MAQPVLMFGVGAAKSGTSWLYRYLAGHPDCHLRSIKELHFFDARDLGNRDWYLRDLTRKAASLERRIAARDDAAPVEDIVKLTDLRLYAHVLEKGETERYLAFLMEEREEERVVGDITPGYSLLSEETLREMAGLTDDVRFVYVMRDPVERLWSHVRMVARRRARGDLRRQAGRILDKVLTGGETHISERGDYSATVTRLKAAVPAGRLFLCTYEDLLTQPMLDRLCAFLGIAPRAGEFRRKMHSGVEISMSDSQRQRAVAWLRPQYDYVAANMGALPPAWQASLAGI